MYKGIKLKIYPNLEQQDKIITNFGYNRFVWNQMLYMMIQRYENNHKAPFLNAFALNNLLKQLKVENPFLKDAESTSLQNTNHDLVEAYMNFFKKHNGFPKFKSRKSPKQSYQLNVVGKNIELQGNKIKLPKLGLIKFRCGRNKD